MEHDPKVIRAINEAINESGYDVNFMTIAISNMLLILYRKAYKQGWEDAENAIHHYTSED